MSRRAAALFLAALAAAPWALAEEPSFEVSYAADKRSVTLGEELVVTVEVAHPKEMRLVPIGKGFRLAPFEVKRVEEIPARIRGGAVRSGWRLTLAAFQLGELAVPPFKVPFADEKGARREVMTGEIKVSVRSVGRTAKDRDDIRGIKGLLRIGRGSGPWRAAVPWAAALLAAALLGALAVRLWRRRPRPDPESLLPPHERALVRFGRLEKKGFAPRESKSYFTELSGILQRYLLEGPRFGSEEWTTEETLAALPRSGFSLGVQEALGRVLGLADLAKFARWEAPPGEAREALELARGIVRETAPRPEGEAQKADAR